jgi:hypothetical protein
MVERKLLPGCRVAIIGGKYKSRNGTLRYETDMRYLVLIDGISTPRYLSKANVVEEDVAAKDLEVDDSVPKSVIVKSANNDASMKALLKEIKAAKELLERAMEMLSTCESEIIRIKNGK